MSSSVERVEREIAGRNLRIETGKLAKQADGAVLVTYGDTVVLVTAVAEPPREPLPFLPLTIEYREKQYAAGKFPGGVIKREGRPTTKEILTMRLIDRPLRALFPEGYNEEIQVVATVLSADPDNDPDLLALIGASAAVSISDIPWDGPVGACRMGLKDDEFIINPTYDERDEGELDLVVCASGDTITMMEGEADTIPEDDLMAAISCAHDACREVEEMIRELVQAAGKEKRSFEPQVDNQAALEKMEPAYYDRIARAHRTAEKMKRGAAMDAIKDEAVAQFCDPEDDNALTEDQVKSAFYALEERAMREQILQENTRYDGRGPDDIRPVECEVAALPRTHGSALFTRGETQALVITTLGTVMDEQRVLDPLTEEPPKKFMLHYNFPPYCVGEVRPIRGPKRREIGHGELAEKAFRSVLPDHENFPYTIRLVSDILESNGSSSMATVCGGTLCLMDAGVPIRHPVAGIALGLVKGEEKSVILTDIAGVEDHCGDMDFKVAGSQHGVTAIQMDLKVEGVSLELLSEALDRARQARLQMLRSMLGVLERPRKEVSRYAPVLRLVSIPQDKIGSLIGPGGKTIQKLEEKYECNIEVEDDGTVTISGEDKEKTEAAAEYVGGLGREVKPGDTYKGVVTELKDFGAIVELFPGVDGLCHISELDEGYVDEVQDICHVGDEMTVKVLSVNEKGTRLSRKQALRDSKE